MLTTHQQLSLSRQMQFADAYSELFIPTFQLLIPTLPIQWNQHSSLPLLGELEEVSPKITISLVKQIAGSYDYHLAGYPNEAYRLHVSQQGIDIQAVTETGVLRAIQTLAQLAEGLSEDEGIEACEIIDWPAFKIRGFMHDVGRSYISVEELKRELQRLGRFKVNTFHFHLTENQAWRFEVKRYPQLTDASAMTRFPGKYYSQADCREIANLAAQYGITVIPEIDMPGHSAAFERAMGHSMQSDQGIKELKDILDEVISTFANAPYIHIGADEQEITYPNFLRIITDYIHQKGKKVVMWNPIQGSSPIGADMTQMWSTAGKSIAGIPNIDCRYNYVNHFDLFADLKAIYNSNIYYAQQGSEEIAGTITAIWNDRLLETEEDIVSQNNLYANVLASTERAWKGGGERYMDEKVEKGKWNHDVSTAERPDANKEEEFVNWERRFLFHRTHSLQEADIPYVKQTNIRWCITEPFPNHSDASMVFPPETEGPKQSYSWQGNTYTTKCTTGAGIYLRHTWGTIVPALYDNPQMNHTAYAWTYVYSPITQEAGAWIEFQNYSRSERDLAPPPYKWDWKGSRIWLNDEELLAPKWRNAGKSIDNEVSLQDENMTARPPMKVLLRQGWNKVFLKLPYIPTPHVRLNKWMFTFVLTDTEGCHALDGITYAPFPRMPY